MRTKRGAIHFEMIISFILFVGFTFFLFLTLKPYETTHLSSSVVSELQDSFIKETNTNLTTFLLKAEPNIQGACFMIKLPDKTLQFTPSKSLVKIPSNLKVNSNIIPSQNSQSELNIDESGNFYKVSYSPEFEQSTLSNCEELDITSYTLGSPFEKKLISYSETEKMKTRYDTDYQNLKKELKLPEVLEFGIISEDLPELNMQSNLPKSGQIISEEHLMEFLYKDGTTKIAKISFQIW